VSVAESAYAAAIDAHAIVVMTEWEEFKVRFIYGVGSFSGHEMSDVQQICIL
jgi:hypothetical protein